MIPVASSSRLNRRTIEREMFAFLDSPSGEIAILVTKRVQAA